MSPDVDSATSGVKSSSRRNNLVRRGSVRLASADDRIRLQLRAATATFLRPAMMFGQAFRSPLPRASEHPNPRQAPAIHAYRLSPSSRQQLPQARDQEAPLVAAGIEHRRCRPTELSDPTLEHRHFVLDRRAIVLVVLGRRHLGSSVRLRLSDTLLLPSAA